MKHIRRMWQQWLAGSKKKNTLCCGVVYDAMVQGVHGHGMNDVTRLEMMGGAVVVYSFF